MGLFGNGKKLMVGKTITIKQAMKYQEDEKYKDYIFPVIETEENKMVCVIQLRGLEKQKEDHNEKQKEKRRKRNENLVHIYDGGKYRGIDQKVSARQKQMQSRVDRGIISYNNKQSVRKIPSREAGEKRYNRWEDAKRYHKEDYQR